MDILDQNIAEVKKVAQDKDVKSRDGTQPKKYFDKKGDDKLAKSTKQDRARHFEKGAKKDDDDSSAYEPAPGDAQAKTKPSKHTKKFKKMFGEDAVAAARLKANQADETDRQKDKHEREVEKLKQKHEKENEKQKAEDEKEKENELMQKQREAQREEVELEEEGAADKSLKKKADKTGISVGILKQVYKRGVAAWRTGHRPGTTPEQWGHARVNSFITKGSGTWGKADKDLADKVRGESIEEGKLVTSYHDIIDLIQGKIKKKIEKEYEKSTEKGLKLINDLGAMIGHKATDKKQEKGKLFLKFGDNIQEDAAVDAANLKAKQTEELERLKAKQEQELEALTDRHERETDKVNQQKEKEVQNKQIQAKRDADRKAAEKQNEERDYKKEYENYHSKPEQVKRRAKRNEARRSLKDRKDIKGKDVHHKDNNPMNNDKSNLSIVSQKYNRTEPRLRKLKEKGILPSGRK